MLLTMKNLILLAIVMAVVSSCGLIDAPIPTDWKHNDPQPVEIDTTDTDTIVPVEVDTCEELIEFTDPAFVTLYIKFDEPQDSVLWEGGGIQSYSLQEIVNHITPLHAKVDTAPIGGNALIKGTNNHQAFQLKVFTRIGGAKWYMGTAMQGLILPGSNASYFKECMVEYPSYNQFSYWGVDCNCEEATSLSRHTLKDCHEGRWYADLHFSPCFIIQPIRDSLDLYGWERIRAASTKYIIDLRSMGKVSDEYLAMVASTGCQIIVADADN